MSVNAMSAAAEFHGMQSQQAAQTRREITQKLFRSGAGQAPPLCFLFFVQN